MSNMSNEPVGPNLIAELLHSRRTVSHGLINLDHQSAIINHIGITASDCDAAVQWYARVFSMQQLGSTKDIPGDFIPPWSLFRRSGKPLQAIRIAFVGNSAITLEILQFTRVNDSECKHVDAPNLKGDMFHIALTVQYPEDTARAIEMLGGQRLGDVVKLENGVSFVHCLDPWGNALELMDGHLHHLPGLCEHR